MNRDHLDRLGPVYYYRQEGELEVAVLPLTFGRARITIGKAGAFYWLHGY